MIGFGSFEAFSLCNPSWRESHSVAQVSFDLLAILPQPPKARTIGVSHHTQLKKKKNVSDEWME